MNEPQWVMTGHAAIAEREQSLAVFGRSDVRKFDGDSAALARSVLELLRSPKSREELLAGLDLQFEGVRTRPELVDELLTHLQASAAVSTYFPTPSGPGPLAGTHVVLAATGAVASAFTPVLVHQLQIAGAEVRVALTSSARRFVAVRSLEALTHHPVAASLWKGTASAPAPHIALAEWADLVLVAPASATTLARLAQGDCSELVAATAIATRAPVVLAASMNGAMLQAPSVLRNLQQLREDGFHIVWPATGFEVADRPEARIAKLGPMPSADTLVRIVCALVPRRAPAIRPKAEFWDRIYAQPVSALLWHCATLDPDLAAALKQGRGRLLDLGCGLGTVAIAAAQLGYQVAASDVSTAALTLARAAAGNAPIDFIDDDFLNSKLKGPFDTVVDRAVLHTLPVASHDRYLRQLVRLLRPGGRLLLKVHSNREEARKLGTTAFDLPRLTALLAPELHIESCTDSSLPGSVEPAPRAFCVVARRT